MELLSLIVFKPPFLIARLLSDAGEYEKNNAGFRPALYNELGLSLIERNPSAGPRGLNAMMDMGLRSIHCKNTHTIHFSVGQEN
ncbi:MAG: hypothetical protein Kow0090_11340 [Myxococcota bacterium]